MKGSRSEEEPQGRGWTRFAVLIAFGAGAVAGIVGITGMREGFSTALYVLGGASAVLLVVALLLSTKRWGASDGPKPLPGEVYGDREKPQAHEVKQDSLDGVPFSESKSVSASSAGEDDELQQRLEQLNKQLQRANVKLGLGELSREGYSKIVEELKERRARVEKELNGRVEKRRDA